MEFIIHLQISQSLFFPFGKKKYKQIPSSSSYIYLYNLAIIFMIFF